ncbi:hypothetical protein G4B88_003245 [Cannabis sativa]|uniref:Zinc knuckle CX2CX4HX4C domain-containing protein n=1 Tax=Cannabis sativa TaxID=3483 RepID=A0A7J6I410_CANSA|nr:hypothetical protein G4B88_003245 [Cannabis sativa]
MPSRASPVYDLPPGIEDAIGMSSRRFRATIDLNKPTFSGFFLRRQKLKDLWIQYKYERLPKLCFKCGLLTHDQSICFKTPTVVKDGSGNFYPMYGIWLKSDAPERSTFTSPLAKWFQDWVLQKQIFLDPTLRTQLKVQKALRNGESADLRECRRQLPGKKRIVSDEEHQEASQDPLAITQLPLVSLPGIGEIAPFGNNTKEVSIQELQELKKVAHVDETTSDTMLIRELAMKFYSFSFEKSYTVEVNNVEETCIKTVRYKLSDKMELKSPPKIEVEEIVEMMELLSDLESEDEETVENLDESEGSPSLDNEELENVELSPTTNDKSNGDIPNYHFEVEIQGSESENENLSAYHPSPGQKVSVTPAPIQEDGGMETYSEEGLEESVVESFVEDN